MEVRRLMAPITLSSFCPSFRMGVLHEPHFFFENKESVRFCRGNGGSIPIGGDVYVGLSIAVEANVSAGINIYTLTYTAYIMPPPDRITVYLESLGCRIEDKGGVLVVSNLPSGEGFSKLTEPVVVSKPDLYFTFISCIIKHYGDFGSRALFLEAAKGTDAVKGSVMGGPLCFGSDG